MDLLPITGARLSLVEGERLEPFLQLGEQLYFCGTKPTLLDAGIAIVIPVNAELQNDPDATQRFRADLAADPANGRPNDMVIRDATNDPRIVAIARRAASLLESGATEEQELAL